MASRRRLGGFSRRTPGWRYPGGLIGGSRSRPAALDPIHRALGGALENPYNSPAMNDQKKTKVQLIEALDGLRGEAVVEQALERVRLPALSVTLP